MCAKVFPPRRMPRIKRVIPGLALSSLPSPRVSALTFIPVSRFSAPWKKMLWKQHTHTPPAPQFFFYTLMQNEKFSWLAVEKEQGNPARGILMPLFFITWMLLNVCRLYSSVQLIICRCLRTQPCRGVHDYAKVQI